MTRKTLLSAAILILMTTTLPAFAQQPRVSPPVKASGEIGKATITIDYSSPSMRGRKIMGDLVPFGKVWRTGANEATTLTTDRDLMIRSLHVPAGTYTLFTVPGEQDWWLIVNKQTGQWGTRYDESQDLGRVPMNVDTLDEAVESFLISIEPTKDGRGMLKLTWENTEASVPIMAH